MSQKRSAIIALAGALIVIVGLVLTAIFSSNPSSTLRDSIGVVAMIGAVSIGIERAIEFGWTALGSQLGTYWPMNVITKEIQDLEAGLDASSFQKIEEGLKKLEKPLSPEELADVQKQLAQVKKQVTNLQNQLPTGEQRVNLVAVTALQGISRLEKVYPQLKSSVAIANQSIIGLADFAATFKDNPGKRIISIFVGGLLGMLVAGLVGLDMFQAILGDSVKLPGLPFLGVALTGLVMGLGSNPTHEVMQILQQVKNNRQGQNDPQPSVGGDATGTSIIVNTAAQAQRSFEIAPGSFPLQGAPGSFPLQGAPTVPAVTIMSVPSDNITTFSLRKR